MVERFPEVDEYVRPCPLSGMDATKEHFKTVCITNPFGQLALACRL